MRWALLALAFFVGGSVAKLVSAPSALQWTLWALCYLAGGWEPGLAGLRALAGKVLDVDLLMVVAAVIAATVGQVFDGALLIIIFATSGALEALATRRTQDSVRSLLALAPEIATLVAEDGSERTVPAAELKVGDVVLVRPGELIASDGVVIGGTSDVDQSSITGESLAALKQTGDEVFSGTVNGAGALEVRVNRAASDSVVARIVQLVEHASATKATMQLFIDRVEQRYSVAMVAATIGFLVVPLLIGAWSFKEALIRAMTFMIVASPCAVVLATMPPLLSAIANAGRHGVLMKSAVALEQLAVVDGVAFDKTGTITRGRPSVSFVTVAPGSSFDRDTVLTLAASAEHPSEHPIGVAIVSAAAERGLQVPAATSFHSLAGRGVEAVVGDHLVEVASPAYALERSRGSSWCEAATRAAHQEGHTVVTVIVDHLQVALIGLDDVVRDDAAEAVAQLEALIGAPALLLTGDNEIVARRVADHVGISHVEADLLPEDKVEQIRRRQDAGRSLLVVGDGVNDAPVLATARFGMAMGQMGADITLQAADGVILRDQLLTLPALLRLARRARRMVYVNLTFAVTVIIVLVTLDISGHLPLPLGVAGHEGSTVVIGLNGLRLLGRRAWRVDVAESAKRIGEPEALEELGKRELTFPAT